MNQLIAFILIIIILYWIYIYKKISFEYFTTTELPYNIWLYWENKDNKKKPSYLDICYETIKKNCGDKFKINLLNDKTVYDYLPNLNKKYIKKLDRIPMKADYIRYNLLYKYGGIWLDSDVIVFKDLTNLLQKLNDYEYVGFGCHYAGGHCKDVMDGYPKPANWVLICRKKSLLMKEVIKEANKLLKKNNKDFFNRQYHILGRNLLWKCIEKLKEKNKDWDYLHVSSRCVERDSHGNKITNNRNISIEDIDEYCNKKRYFMPIYNTAPGFPKWFMDMSKNELLNSNILISKYFRNALEITKKKNTDS